METTIVGSQRVSGTLARTAASEFEKIRKEQGRLTPALVVASARDRRSPLHSWFTWDNRRAAEAHRLEQAAELIRSVRIVIRSDPNDQPRTIRAHVSIVSAKGREYVPAVEALSIEEYREQLLSDALRELDAFKAKYRDLQALSAVFAAISKVKTPRSKSAA